MPVDVKIYSLIQTVMCSAINSVNSLTKFLFKCLPFALTYVHRQVC